MILVILIHEIIETAIMKSVDLGNLKEDVSK